MTHLSPRKTTHEIPVEIIDILGPPPLLSSETAAVYYAVLSCFARYVVPRDIIAWMLIKDLADYRAEIARWRQLKAVIIQNAYDAHFNDLESRLVNSREFSATALTANVGIEMKEAKQTLANKPEELSKRLVELHKKNTAGHAAREKKHAQDLATLEALKVSPHDLCAAVLDEWIHDFQKVDALLEIAEKRFGETLHELERYICGFGEELRKRIDKIIDGDVMDAPTAATPVRVVK